MRNETCRILVDLSAWRNAVAVASKQQEVETGGILLGCRHSTDIYVSEFVEVPDRTSTRSSYVRRETVAAELLEGRIGAHQEGSLDGYVGEWHTHPERQGPSRTDRSEIKKISKHSCDEIALIVVVYDPCASQWEPAGYCARSGRARRAAIKVQATGDAPTGEAKPERPK